MTTHNLCDACETAAHCSRNGCIPLVDEAPVRKADAGCPCPTACQVPEHEAYDDELSGPAKAMVIVFCLLALGCAVSPSLVPYLPNWM